jgi:ribonuclease Z
MAEKVKIVFLGTGSMIPDEKRNHPAFLLIYKNENILVDCGEGTQVQFRKAKLNPCKITKILITHWHGDHTFGLPGLLRTMATSGYNKKLSIYGPRGFQKHMNEMFVAFGNINEFKIDIKEVSGKFFENEDFYLEAEKMIHVQPCNAYSFVLKKKTRLDKKKMSKLKIKKGPHLSHLKRNGYMVYDGKKHKLKDLSFEESGKKISFVLDTIQNEKITSFVKDSDVLISEATFGKGQEKLAKEYQHLTSIQAAEIAKKSKVRKLYLVHLSQRYSKEPKKILLEAQKFFKNSEMPKDLEEISV